MSAGFTSLWKRASRTYVKNPRPRVFPTAESLERRYALDAVPFAQIVSPTSNPLIGEEVNYTVRFDNTAVAQSDIGYSPFVDIVMPKTGDAATQTGQKTVDNGISFKPGTAKYNGLSLTTDVVVFDANGDATHPFAKDAQGQPLVIKGTPGDELVVVQLPFGSYGPDQPPIDINFTGVVSSDAQPNPVPAYTIVAQGGFRYDTDLANNPTVDVATMGQQQPDPVQPQLFRVTKTSDVPEGETVTGPNFTHTYSVNVAVAAGQTVTDLVLTDDLPDTVQFVTNTSTAGTEERVPSTTIPGGTLEQKFASVTGTGSNTDAVMSFTYYIPQNDASGNNVIPLNSGGTQTITNPSQASGHWTSTNPDFNSKQETSDPKDPNSQHVLSAQTVGVQKSFHNVSSTNGYKVGDTIEYTLRFEVSDYFALGSAVLSDILSDGQEFDTSFTPQFQYTQQTQSFPSSDFDPSNYSVTTDPNGEQTVSFDLSQELNRLGLATNVKLLGAGIPSPNGTGDPLIPPTSNPGGPGTEGIVRFRATVRNDYRVAPSEGPAVVQGDRLNDTARFTASVLKYDNLDNTFQLVTDASQRGFTLTSGNTHKSVFAINGSPPTTNQRVIPGDDVTFKITYDVPFSSIDNYTIKDFLPLPIFVASTSFQYDPTLAGTGTAPPENYWTFGSNDTFSLVNGGPIPSVSPNTSVTANTQTNSLTWDFGSYSDVQNRDGKTEILFTVNVTNRPFGDGLKLTNQAQQSETNANGDRISSNPGITQVQVGEPELAITKGVISTDNPTGEFVQGGNSSTSPPLPAGVISFTPPGQNTPAFTGTVTSSGIASTPIDATLENVLGNDLVKFSIVVENTGSSPNGAFDVTIADTLEPRYQIPTNVTGLNLQVTDGAGTSLAYVGDLFSGGITLIDQGPSIASDDAASYQARTYPKNSPPPNNGTGFGNWVIAAPTSSGSFVGTTALSTTTGTNTFGVTSNGNGENASIRLFANPLSDGQAFSADVAVNAFNNGTKGFGFHAVGDTSDIFTIRLFVEAGTGNWKYKLSNSATLTDTTIPFVADAPIKVRVEQTSGSDVIVSMQQAGSSTWSTTLSVPARIDSAGFSSLGTSSPGKQSNIGFDNLEITGAATQGALGPGKLTDGTVIDNGKNIAVVTYDLQIRPTVAPLDVIPNTGKVTNYASIEGGPNFVSAGGIKDDTNVTIQGPEVSKTLVKTSIDDTYNANNQAVIGEIATYNLRIDVPRGTTPNAVITDTLSKALGFVKVTNIQTDAGVTIGNTAGANNPTLSTDGSGNNIATFNLGDITNTNPDTQRHGVTITFEAVVLNDRSVTSSSPAIHNKAKLDWTGHSLPDVSAGPLTVIEPKITVSKSVAPNNVQAGDTVTYTIVVSGHDTTARVVKLEDILPTGGITYVQGSLQHISGVTPKLSVSGNGSGFTAEWNTLNPHETSTLTFSATVNANVVSGQRIRNDAVVRWTSLGNPSPITTNYANAVQRDGSGSHTNNQLNNYKTQNRAVLRVEKPHVTKTLIATSIDNTNNTNTQAVIGETATYEITVTIPQGHTPAARLLDWMGDQSSPDQLAYVSSTVPVVNSSALTVPGLTNAPVYEGTTTQRTVRWDFGDIVNTDTNPTTDETITFAVVTRVLNVNNNIQGVSVANHAQLKWSRNSLSNVATNQDVKVIEPKLTTSKTAVVGGLGGNPGDPVTYTIIIQQDAASATDAYDVTLDDIIPAEIGSPVLTNVVDTDTINPVSSANFQLSGNTLTTPLPFDMKKDLGRTITLTINGTLQGPFKANQKITNTNTVHWTSLPNSSGPLTPNPTSSPYTYERTGSRSTTDGQLNNYSKTSSTSFPVNTVDLVVTKTVDDKTPDVGDTITFTVTVRNDGPSTATGVELTDTFLTTGLQLDTSGIVAAPGTTYVAATGVWTIGTLLNGDSVQLTLPAKVTDPAVGTKPDQQVNSAQITAVVEPDKNTVDNKATAIATPKYADLQVLKKTSNPTPNDGETITYTITLTNKGPDTVTGVELTDTLPNPVTYVPGSDTATSGTTFNTTGTPITGGIWSVPSIDPGDVFTLEFKVVAQAGGLSYNEIEITDKSTWDPVLSNNISRTPIDPQDADVSVTKVVDNPTPQVGDNVTFTITVKNNGPDTAKAVEVTDNLPPTGFQFVGTPTTTTGLYDTNTGIWTVGDLIDAQTETLTIVAKVLAPPTSIGPGSSFTNTADADSKGPNPTPDPNPGNNTDSAFVTPLQTDLAVVKGVSDATPNIGDVIQFVIGVANYGPADATLVNVTDVIPTGLTYLGPTSGLGTNPTRGTPSETGGTVKWDIGTLPSGDVEFFVFDARVEAPTPAGIPPTVTNTAVISGKEHDPDPSNNTSSVVETPLYADLIVDKQVSAPTPNVGDIITYTISVTNNGTDDATDVILTDTLHTLSGLSITGTPAPTVGTFDKTTGKWNIGTIPNGKTVTLSIQAKVLTPTTGNPVAQTNTATVTAKQYDPDPSNNTDSATETPKYADLKVTKTVDQPAPNVAQNVTFTIGVVNLGKDSATDVFIDDVLPTGLSFVSTSDPLAYNDSTGVWTVGTVDVGLTNTKTLTITANVTQSGTFTNDAEVSTTHRPKEYDPDPTNNKGSATVKTREADLEVTKKVDDAAPNVGDVITFTVTVSNHGPDTADNIEITDTFPTAGLQLLTGSVVASAGTFDAGTGIWEISSLANGSSATLTLPATVLAPPTDTIPPSQTNVAKVTDVDEHDPNPLNNQGQVTETPKYADLSVEKISSDAEPNVGGTFTYTVTLKNNSTTTTANNVEVVENFPGNIDVLQVSPTNTHTTTQWIPDTAGTGGQWRVPTIAPGQSEVLVIHARAISTGRLPNVATITHSSVWDPNSGNNQAKTPTDPQQADLVVTKKVDNDRPEVGGTVIFTITLENKGPTDAQNVEVADLLPTPGLTYQSHTESTGGYSEITGVWTVGTATAFSTQTLTITATVDPPVSGTGPVSPTTNTATATSTTVDPNPGNNTDFSTVTPLQADLAITKDASDPKPQVGSTFNYVIEVANLGTDTASNVVVNDLLPTGVTYQSDIATTGNYVAGTGVWTIGVMSTGDRQTLTITVLVTTGNSGGKVTNTGTVTSGTWDPNLANNTATKIVDVPPRDVLVGTDIGCETGPYVRVIDPDTGATRLAFFAYEPAFRGGVRVYGADVTGDGNPEIITAPGPGRPGEVRVWQDNGSSVKELTNYSFFPFGPSYTGGVEISEGSITTAGATEIVTAQNLGGLVNIFEVTPGAANPINTTPVRQLRPFGSSYLGGVTIDTADIGTVSGNTVTSATPDGIMELFVGSGFGIQAQVRGYNGTTAAPTLFNSFNVMSSGYNRGVSVARLPSSTSGNADRILVSSGIDGNTQVETYNGRNSTREAVFQAYGNSRTQVFSAAIDDDSIFNVQGLLGTTTGVQKSLSPTGTSKATLTQSTSSYPPLRVAILRN